MKNFLWLLVSLLLNAQETTTLTNVKIYPNPDRPKNMAIGELYSGTKITKLKKDKSGKFVKATVEFYIPIESLEEGRVSLLAGAKQSANNATYTLLKATKNGKKIIITLHVKNNHSKKEMDFLAMALLKVVGKGDNKGELNPFEGKHQGLAIIKPKKSITANLVYNFKSMPKNVELVCTGKLNGDKVYFNLGF